MTEKQIAEARQLRSEKGYTKRKLADYFSVGQTTIWDNVFCEKKEQRIFLIPKITTFVVVVGGLRQQGYNSKQVAEMFDAELEEINIIYANR